MVTSRRAVRTDMTRLVRMRVRGGREEESNTPEKLGGGWSEVVRGNIQPELTDQPGSRRSRL